MKYAVLILALASLVVSAHARTWTSKDGNKIEADFISATPTHVTILRASDNRKFTIELTKVSKGDVDWIKANSKTPAPAARPLGAAAIEVPEGFPDDVSEMLSARGTLLFEDDFERTDSASSDDLGPDWKTNSESRAGGAKQNDLEAGTLVMTLSDKADHAISTRHTLSGPFKDGVVSVKVLLEEDEQLKLAYNDREEPSVWAGHVNGVTIALDKVTIEDEREGRFKLALRDNQETEEGKEAMEEALKKTSSLKSISLKPGKWIDVVTVHNGESLTVYLNGYKIHKFSSPGIGHETKRDFVFAVPKRATVDELKIWKLEPTPAE